jgi:hypothetical protein
LVSFISSFIFLDIANIVAESSHYCHSCEKNSVCWLIADLYLQPTSGSWWHCWGCCGSWSLPYIFLLKGLWLPWLSLSKFKPVLRYSCDSRVQSHMFPVCWYDIRRNLCNLFSWVLPISMLFRLTYIASNRDFMKYQKGSHQMQTDFLFQDYIFVGSILDLEVALKLHQA